ncbi:MAG: outer membrane beta-barrel protein [Bacteroidota bacterium]|nr:outer membrane beta-barrel protein [Bacteroidota bacterium]
MKHTIVSALLFISFLGAKAQDQKLSFGLKIGANLQTFNGKDDEGRTLDFSLVPRYNVGFNLDIPVATDFYFQTGLLFTTKGAKSTTTILGVKRTDDFNLSYIELPMNLLYKPVLGNGRIMLGFGPYLAYGIGGKRKTNIDGTSSERKIEFTNSYNDVNPNEQYAFKPIDFGANLFFGYEFQNGINIHMNTQLGLAKINASNKSFTADRRDYKNTGFGLSLGYKF